MLTGPVSSRTRKESQVFAVISKAMSTLCSSPISSTLRCKKQSLMAGVILGQEMSQNKCLERALLLYGARAQLALVILQLCP